MYPDYSDISARSFHSTGLTTSRNRIFAIALLLAIVVLFAPHQFAFLVILLVQYDTTVRSHIAAKQALVSDIRKNASQAATDDLAYADAFVSRALQPELYHTPGTDLPPSSERRNPAHLATQSSSWLARPFRIRP